MTVEGFATDKIGCVDVTGISKGRGFTGVMRRHGFGGKSASHGTERKHRSAGSISGGGSGPTGRGVRKGKRMAGHAGNVRRTTLNLKLLKVDADNHLLVVRGSVPGPNGSVVLVRQSKKKD